MPLPPGEAPHGAALALKAWRMVQVPGVSVETVAELLGVDDMELLLAQLMMIREFAHG